MKTVKLKGIYDGKVPKYCRDCGRKLVKKGWFYDFDPQTGVKRFGTTLRCPVTFAYLLDHTFDKFDYDGDEIIPRYP